MGSRHVFWECFEDAPGGCAYSCDREHGFLRDGEHAFSGALRCLILYLRCSRFVNFGHFPPHGFSLELKTVRVMHDPIKDGICKRVFADRGIPLIGG